MCFASRMSSLHKVTTLCHPKTEGHGQEKKENVLQKKKETGCEEKEEESRLVHEHAQLDRVQLNKGAVYWPYWLGRGEYRNPLDFQPRSLIHIGCSVFLTIPRRAMQLDSTGASHLFSFRHHWTDICSQYQGQVHMLHILFRCKKGRLLVHILVCTTHLAPSFAECHPHDLSEQLR